MSVPIGDQSPLGGSSSPTNLPSVLWRGGKISLILIVDSIPFLIAAIASDCLCYPYTYPLIGVAVGLLIGKIVNWIHPQKTTVHPLHRIALVVISFIFCRIFKWGSLVSGIALGYIHARTLSCKDDGSKIDDLDKLEKGDL